MQSAYYIAMLIGVTWLCLWCAVPDDVRRRFWWPFDMRDAPGPEGGEPASGSRARGWRARAAANGTARASRRQVRLPRGEGPGR